MRRRIIIEKIPVEELAARRSATGGETVCERRKFSRLKSRQEENQRSDKRHQRCDRFCRAHLPTRKQGNGAMVVERISIRVNQLMQRSGSGKKLQREKQHQAERS